ncbi:MAG TPA: MFS transporter, partial [Candidatus Udaeobacter sp.]|nr:MFS transporter [Candidatus Udaeobacter sp.]
MIEDVAGGKRSRLDRLLGGRLWRSADFVKLWLGQFVSEAGSQVSVLALPTVAILILHATPFQVGLLTSLEFLAFPTLGLIAGVYSDRFRRIRIMAACDLLRTLVYGSVPLTWALGILSMEQLYAVALLAGVCTVFFDVSYQSYLPALVDRRDLVEGNSKLEVTRSIAQLAGPALAGFLIQLVGAALSVLVDSASYIASVASLLAIRKPEPDPRPSGAVSTGFWHELMEGVQVVFGNSTLWKIAGSTATSNLGSNIFFAVFLIFAYRHLHLSPATVGLVFAAGAVGGLLGALTTGAVTSRLGLGRTLLVTVVSGGAVSLLVPLAQYGFAVPILAVTSAIALYMNPVYNINQVSLRQSITPDRVQGRMNATMRTIVWGTLPIGAFIGGILGST